MPHTALLLYSLSHRYPKPLAFGEADLRPIVTSRPRLAALWINLLFAANLSISVFWLAAPQTEWLGAVVQVPCLWGKLVPSSHIADVFSSRGGGGADILLFRKGRNTGAKPLPSASPSPRSLLEAQNPGPTQNYWIPACIEQDPQERHTHIKAGEAPSCHHLLRS